MATLGTGVMDALPICHSVGLLLRGLDPPVTALIGDTFGLRSIGIIMGTLNIAWGIGSAVGPVVGGLVFDASSDYSLAFIAGAAAMLIVSVLVALIKRETNRNKS